MNNIFTSKDLMGGMRKQQAAIAEAIERGENVHDIHPTIILGLLTEVDCFKAIKEMGDIKFYLKGLLKKEIEKQEKNQREINRLSCAINQVHSNQLIVINDVCKRFEVIHPEFKDPPKELVEKRRPYWTWYAENHKKVYGEEIAILDKPTKPAVNEEKK